MASLGRWVRRCCMQPAVVCCWLREKSAPDLHLPAFLAAPSVSFLSSHTRRRWILKRDRDQLQQWTHKHRVIYFSHRGNNFCYRTTQNWSFFQHTFFYFLSKSSKTLGIARCIFSSVKNWMNWNIQINIWFLYVGHLIGSFFLSYWVKLLNFFPQFFKNLNL